MAESPNVQWNNEEIADRLKSAVDILTPDVLDRIDLETPQEYYGGRSKTVQLYRRVRTAATVAAACLCVAVLGAAVGSFQNSRVRSLIGIDVNPSIELSVNRNDKVLKVHAFNGDAEEILDDMELKNVDLNIAVNAVIGSMVRHGYLEGEDNTILVTVSSENEKKAAALRQDVVVDIENSLEEHKLQAVVYDQQANVTDAVKDIAGDYDISYGKAYFLKELVDENNLSEEELRLFADMTMEEISREIAERSYSVRKDGVSETEESRSEEKESTEITTAAQTAAPDTTAASSEVPPESKAPESTSAAATPPATQPATAPPETTVPAESTEESGSGKRAKVDYVDYEGGSLNIVFKDKVKWKSPTVSVKDENGESYSARITDTGMDSCEISISGLPGGMNCSFTVSGVAAKEGGAYGTLTGYFDTPDIAEDVTEPSETEPEGLPEQPTAEPTSPSEPPAVLPVESETREPDAPSSDISLEAAASSEVIN